MHDFDVIVIGGGHAGTEAAGAVSRSGGRAALVTMRADTIGVMSCNPAVGGLAKGQIVREVDALGGLMGRCIDATGIQFRLLNSSKGPAVQSPRAQADKYAYAEWLRAAMLDDPNITVIEGEAVEINCGLKAGHRSIRNRQSETRNHVTGVTLADGRTLRAPAVVVTTGTFLRGLMHTGEAQTPGGRVGEAASNGLSESLAGLGLELGRLKTGTCPRLSAGSIDYSALDVQPGDVDPEPFSFLNDRIQTEQACCWITSTNGAVHDLIRANLHRAPLFSGQIRGRGPRYCPSIEDKIVRFADKDSHHIFLEPESRRTDEIYCNGIPTSLPADVQERMVHSIRGLERARILRFGYAVEYDFVPPTQLAATLETKAVAGLFLAGQINGTSGYEEAAGQGILAGINAARFAAGGEPITIGRDQAYIGVMVDDLVTRGADEPYRMFTSRAEHRLHLRSDNADRRLTPLAEALGIAGGERVARFRAKESAISDLIRRLRAIRVDNRSGMDLLRRPEVSVAELCEREPKLLDGLLDNGECPRASPACRGSRMLTQVVRQVEIEVKYSGYIEQALRQIERFRRMEDRLIPPGLDFRAVPQLRNEAKDKFSRLAPRSIGQAGRISGINPSDLAVLLIHLERRKGVSP